MKRIPGVFRGICTMNAIGLQSCTVNSQYLYSHHLIYPNICTCFQLFPQIWLAVKEEIGTYSELSKCFLRFDLLATDLLILN
jgi:hypothetical protein